MGAALAATARAGAAGLAAIPLETARVAAKEAIVKEWRAGGRAKRGEEQVKKTGSSEERKKS